MRISPSATPGGHAFEVVGNSAPIIYTLGPDTMRQPSDHHAIETSPGRLAALADEHRLGVLASYEVDALEDDTELLAIVRFAARMCDAPIAQISLVERERQYFLASHGVTERETSREGSFCDHAMRRDALMEVRDTIGSERFAHNRFVTGPPSIRFYAGQPLVADDGMPLGTLCVIDHEPRPEGLDELQRQGLEVLAQAVMRRLDGNRNMARAARAIEERETRLKRMIDGVPQIAWSADAAGNFNYFNTRWSKVTGEAPPRVTEDWRPFIHPDDAANALSEWHRCFAAGEELEIEYRLRQADGEWRWMLALAMPVADDAAGLARWFGTITDIDEVHKLSEARDLLGRELAHRIKNIFAVVVGLVSLESRRQPEHRGFADALIETLRALGRAHDFVRPAGGATRASLRGLLAMLFAPYGADRVAITGGDAAISPRAATPLALVFHELATNSAKYGALGEPSGLVTLELADQGETMLLVWREHGGPDPGDGEGAGLAGGDTGFGSRLVEMSVTGQLGGSWLRRFEPGGLVVELTISRRAIAP